MMEALKNLLKFSLTIIMQPFVIINCNLVILFWQVYLMYYTCNHLALQVINDIGFLNILVLYRYTNIKMLGSAKMEDSTFRMPH